METTLSFSEKIWKESIGLDDPLAELGRKYLISRGLSADNCPKVARFHPSLEYWDSEKNQSRGLFPTLIFKISDKTRKGIGLQRIYLTNEGDKAPYEDAKKILKKSNDTSISGGAIQFDEPGEVLGVGEGPENALAVRQATGIPMWSAVTATLMEKVEIPATVKKVKIFSDKDVSWAGIRAAEKLAERLLGEKKEVSIILPNEPIPEEAKGVDWLDILVKKGPAAICGALEKAVPYQSKTIELTALIQNPPHSIDPAAMHGLAGEFVRLLKPQTESDPIAILIQFLVAFGNVIRRLAYFPIEADQHFTNLFVVLVGESSKGRKGTSWGYIRRIFERAEEGWAKKCVSSGLSSGEGLIWRVRDPIEKTQPIRDNKTKEIVRYETIIDDPGIEDKRLLLQEGEFASVLKVMDRIGNTLSPIIRNAFDSGNLRTLVKNFPANATGAHISIVGHITKTELLRFLNSTEAANGFGNRFIWIWVARSRYLPLGGRVDEGLLDELAQKLVRAIQFVHDAKQLILSFDSEAEKIWCGVYEVLSKGKPGLLGSLVSRAESQVLRLAEIYALLDLTFVIRSEHLNAALAVWDYSEDSCKYIFGDTVGDPVADEIMLALKKSSNGLTRTEINDCLHRNKPMHAIENALSILNTLGLARCESHSTGGRPIERWFFNQRPTKETKQTK